MSRYLEAKKLQKEFDEQFELHHRLLMDICFESDEVRRLALQSQANAALSAMHSITLKLGVVLNIHRHSGF